MSLEIIGLTTVTLLQKQLHRCDNPWNLLSSRHEAATPGQGCNPSLKSPSNPVGDKAGTATLEHLPACTPAFLTGRSSRHSGETVFFVHLTLK